VVAGGSSGIGYDTAAGIVAGGGSAVIVGRDQARVDDAVATLSNDGPAYGITADLADRMQVARVERQLADEHADATLLVNAAGFFIPSRFWSTTVGPTTPTSSSSGDLLHHPDRMAGRT
jgi:short-subunit dehydrogenase